MKTLLFAISCILLLTGCTEYRYSSKVALDSRGVVELQPGIYIKSIRINPGGTSYDSIYVYCDREGRIITGTAITTDYIEGKTHRHLTVLNTPE